MPPLKTEKRKLPGFPLQSFAGQAGIPTSPPVRGPGPCSPSPHNNELHIQFLYTPDMDTNFWARIQWLDGQ